MKKLLALCLTVVLCLCCLASCGILESHSISYQDADTERLLMDGYAPKRAKPGDTVVLRTGPIMDADLDFYANGVKLENTHNDSDYWEYTFIMPDEDVVITHKMSGGFIQVKCEDHVDEDANGSCDNCGHRHTITYVSAGESGHFENYTCGCPQDFGAVPHYDENDDYICDACGYEYAECDHQWDDGVEIEGALGGYVMEYTCTLCGDKQRETITIIPPSGVSHSISYQSDRTKEFLMEGFVPTEANPGDTVVLRTNPIMDADLAFYANGVRLTQTHADSDYWEYIFTMPDEDVVITHEITDGFLPD